MTKMMDKLISQQAAFDALHRYFADGFEEDRWWNSTHVIAALKGLPSIQPTISILKNVEDAISRQDAIKYCYDLINAENPSGEHDYWNYSQERINQTEVILHHLEVMPSVQPETNCSEFPNNWIPCSERLPEIDKEVLVTDGKLCWVCSLFESPDIEDGLYQWEDNYGHWYELETWVAWMPLPEPYQGGEQDG